SLATATPALAGHGRGHDDKWRRGDYVAPAYGYRYASPRVVYVRDHSYGAPLLAGFVGGLLVGASVHAEPVHAYCPPPPPPPPATFFYDPYCDMRFSSFDGCAAHEYYEGHPRVIQVIEVSSGDCVGSFAWYRGSWHHRDNEDDD